MANIIGIMGESGAGKTTSMRNLDPKTTYYIDCDKKGLSWRGWKKQYNAENKNYFSTDKQNDVLTIMQGINTDRPRTVREARSGIWFPIRSWTASVRWS